MNGKGSLCKKKLWGGDNGTSLQPPLVMPISKRVNPTCKLKNWWHLQGIKGDTNQTSKTEKGKQSSESEEGVQDSSFYWNLPQTLNCSSELHK